MRADRFGFAWSRRSFFSPHHANTGFPGRHGRGGIPALGGGIVCCAGLAVLLVLACCGWPAQLHADTAKPAKPKVIGWIERVKVYPGNIEFFAKIDTGADSTSLNAPKYKREVRDDGEWVTFNAVNRFGKSTRFEAKIVRIARIKRHRGPTQLRPVIMLGLCLGNTYRMTPVSIVDRSRFNYQLLVGRRYMAGYFAVDAHATFTTEPNCDDKDRQ